MRLFHTVSQITFSETHRTEGSNLLHTYSEGWIFGPERWYRSGAYGSLIRVIHTLYEYAKSCSSSAEA